MDKADKTTVQEEIVTSDYLERIWKLLKTEVAAFNESQPQDSRFRVYLRFEEAKLCDEVDSIGFELGKLSEEEGEYYSQSIFLYFSDYETQIVVEDSGLEHFIVEDRPAQVNRGIVGRLFRILKNHLLDDTEHIAVFSKEVKKELLKENQGTGTADKPFTQQMMDVLVEESILGLPGFSTNVANSEGLLHIRFAHLESRNYIEFNITDNTLLNFTSSVESEGVTTINHTSLSLDNVRQLLKDFINCPTETPVIRKEI